MCVGYSSSGVGVIHRRACVIACPLVASRRMVGKANSGCKCVLRFAMSNFRSRWGDRSIALPTPPPLSPPGPVRGRMHEQAGVNNFEASPLISRVPHLKRANYGIDNAEKYRQLSDEYLKQIGNDRKSQLRANAMASLSAIGSPRSTNAEGSTAKNQSSFPLGDIAVKSMPPQIHGIYGKEAQKEALVKEKLAQYRVQEASDTSVAQTMHPGSQPSPREKGTNRNRFSYLLDNMDAGYSPYKDMPKESEEKEGKQEDPLRQEPPPPGRRHHSDEWISTNVVAHQIHQRSPPPKERPRKSKEDLGMFNTIFDHQKSNKPTGSRHFKHHYGSVGVHHKMHERSPSPVSYKRAAESQSERAEEEKLLDAQPNTPRGLSLLDKLPTGANVAENVPCGIRVYPDRLAQQGIEPYQGSFSPRHYRSSVSNRPVKVQFGAQGNLESSVVARSTDDTTSKVARFVINQDPDVKETRKKNFELNDLTKDSVQQEHFNNPSGLYLPLPKTHPVLQINSSRKKQYPGKAYQERSTGLDYSTVDSILHVMEQPLAAPAPPDDAPGSARRTISLSMPKALGRRRHNDKKQGLLATQPWCIPEYPDPGDQLANRKQFYSKRSSADRARDFMGGKDVILPSAEAGATGVFVYDKYRAPESMGVKAKYAKESTAYWRAGKTWVSMVGSDRNSNANNMKL
jgi:hypothetical protein